MAKSKQKVDVEEVRVRNPFGQIARTVGEEKAAWGRRIRRWKRKAVGAHGVDEVNETIINILATPADTLSKEDKGLKLWKFKAAASIGEDEANALLKLYMSSEK